jgi:predicted DNA-binding transcriptional regulator YafY
VYGPTTRLLTVLEVLQARGRVGCRELAERLEVDARSVRRYVRALQDAGVPILSERGRHGGYRLRPGFKLPPLMFTEDEALAITLGLLLARRGGLASAAPAVEGALAKLERVLPEPVRTQVAAVEETLVLDLPEPAAPPGAGTVLAFSAAIRDRRTLRLRYASPRGTAERLVDPYGLVHRSGRWYAVGWCHLRGGVRLFRLDRMERVEPADGTFTPPPGFDVREHLVERLADMFEPWSVEVTVPAGLAAVRRWVSPAVARLTEVPGGVLLRCRADNLDWMAYYLARLPWPVTVLRPPELLPAFDRLLERVRRLAETAAAGPAPDQSR